MVSQLQETEGGLLDFDEEYLQWVFQQNIDHCREVYGPDGYRGYGMGRIEETLSAAYSLVGAHKSFSESSGLLDWLHPGDVARTPGRYEEYDAENGHSHPTGVLLRGTGETIHPTVRLRVSAGGKGVISTRDVEEKSYEPHGLKDWDIVALGGNAKDTRLTDANAKGFAWKAQNSGQILQESSLGRFEKSLLGMSENTVKVTTSSI
jgi:hypothetical protein